MDIVHTNFKYGSTHDLISKFTLKCKKQNVNKCKTRLF